MSEQTRDPAEVAATLDRKIDAKSRQLGRLMHEYERGRLSLEEVEAAVGITGRSMFAPVTPPTVAERILDLLSGGPMRYSELQKRLKISGTYLNSSLTHLAKMGKLAKLKRGKYEIR